MKTNWRFTTRREAGEKHPAPSPVMPSPFTTRRPVMKEFLSRSATVGAALTLSLFYQSPARADLFVVGVSEPAGHSEVIRLDERSGAVTERWTMGDESVNGIAVSMLGDVYVAGNRGVVGEIIRSSP